MEAEQTAKDPSVSVEPRWGICSLPPSPHCPFRAVTDSINQLITMCTQQAPGQKECDNALRELEVGTGQTGQGRD